MIEEIKTFYKKTKFYFDEVEKTNFFEWPVNWIKIYFKTYPRMKKVKLIPSNSYSKSLVDCLKLRESNRIFLDEEIDFNIFSEILVNSFGIKNLEKELDKTKRNYPSAGARYPLETYIISNNIKNLEKGIYHFNIKGNELELLLNQDLKETSQEIFGKGNYEENPNFLILSGVMSCTEVKYSVNAYRFACIECGHAGQNFSLLCTDKDIGCCAIGGFDNDNLTALLDLTEDEIPLYAFAFGKLK